MGNPGRFLIVRAFVGAGRTGAAKLGRGTSSVKHAMRMSLNGEHINTTFYVAKPKASLQLFRVSLMRRIAFIVCCDSNVFVITFDELN
jgi:hypothetical protein